MQQALLQRVADSDPKLRGLWGPASRTNPAAHYVDPARYGRELQVLFRGRPLLAGLSAECPQPGDYFTGTFGGVPLMLMRQGDGSLAALVNACRHRAAPLLQGRGTGARGIVCGYHGWSYRTDGSLLSRPSSDGAFDDVTLPCDLHRRPVAERHGLIFVRPEGEAPIDVDRLLAGMEDDFASYDLADYTHIDTRANTWRMNWKLVMDTFMESYHIRWLHSRSISPAFVSEGTIFDAFGDNLRTIGLRKGVWDEVRDKPPAEWSLIPYGTIQYTLIPNALLVHQLDHIQLWRLAPVDVNTTLAETSIFAPEPPRTDKALRHWTKNLDLLLGVTNTEDFPLMEQIHANLASGAMPELIYGRNEPALVHLHNSLDALLGAAEPPVATPTA